MLFDLAPPLVFSYLLGLITRLLSPHYNIQYRKAIRFSHPLRERLQDRNLKLSLNIIAFTFILTLSLY